LVRHAVVNSTKIIVGDCAAVIPTLKHKYEFVFADPPFNIGHPYKGYNDKREWGDYWQWTRAWIAAAWGRCAGVMALHGPDELCEQYLLTARHEGFHKNRIAWVNWHYRFGQCGKSNWIDSRCHCLIYAKDTANYTWHPDEVLVQSDRVAYGDKRTEQAATPGQRLPLTVWGVAGDGPYWGRVQGNSKERWGEHPNQLPEVYMERLIRAYTNPGDKVLECFCGSGTTPVVAAALGRRCLAIDISVENAASAQKRIERGAVRVKGI
jgi:DNA modification methylase